MFENSEIATLLYCGFLTFYLLIVDVSSELKATSLQVAKIASPLTEILFRSQLLVALFHFTIAASIVLQNNRMKKVLTCVYALFFFFIMGNVLHSKSVLQGQVLSEGLERLAFHAAILSLFFGIIKKDEPQQPAGEKQETNKVQQQQGGTVEDKKTGRKKKQQ